jgi:hypothetical protein
LITWNKAYWTGRFAVESTNKSNGASVGKSNKYLMRFMGGDKGHDDVLFFIISGNDENGWIYLSPNSITTIEHEA